ncbi:MAG: alpha/beta fold hydrolase [Planctomycetota bacterium]
MNPSPASLPSSLSEHTTFVELGDGVPALVAIPPEVETAPALFWMHGRSVYKELDSGRYLRLLRAGIATIAVDLPGHGARAIEGFVHPEHSLDVLEQMVGEIDEILSSLRQHAELGPRIDFGRLAIGGMSLGGTATLRRLCEPHPFRCAHVEGTTGDLLAFYFPEDVGLEHQPPSRSHTRERVESLSACAHTDTWDPIPLLALHNELDKIVPLATQQRFIEKLRAHYASEDADASVIGLHVYPESGAPSEHAGFGRHAADAKTRIVAFLSEYLLG